MDMLMKVKYKKKINATPKFFYKSFNYHQETQTEFLFLKMTSDPFSWVPYI